MQQLFAQLMKLKTAALTQMWQRNVHDLLDPPRTRLQHTVRQKNRLFHVVSHQHRGDFGPRTDRQQFVLHVLAGQGVQRAKGLVQQQHARAGHQAASNRHPLRHAARQLIHKGTFLDAYPKASVLRSVLAPASGGDTVWANTATAYAKLPTDLQQLADKLWTVHSNEYDYASAKPDVSAEKLERYRKVFTSTVYETEHSVVRVHPVSGEKSLVLGHFVKRIKGYSPADSAHLFNLLQSHVTRLENTVRWRWNTGDVAIWDNRSTQHYALDDYGVQDRIVRRVTLQGDVPVSVQGQRSQTTKGA